MGSISSLGSVKVEHRPPNVVIKERIIKLSQASPQNEYDDAVELIQSKLEKISSVNQLFAVNLGSNHPSVIIDARAGSAKILESTDEKLAGTVKIRPNKIRTFVDGLMEPRYAINWGYFMVEGKVSLGMKFLDALGPYNPTTIKLDPDLKLPVPTEDFSQAKKDFDEFGYSLVKNAISAQEVEKLYVRLKEQAAAEAEAGVAQFDGGIPGADSGPNQRVYCIANKGQEFLDLLENKVIDEFLPDLIGDDAILFSYNANIVREGNIPMILHTDQITVQPPVRDIAFGFNLLYFLKDVTKETGGTLIMPKSHKGQIAPDDLTDTTDFISVEGPAGTCLVLDSRTWHSTGRNTKPGSERPVIIMFFAKSSILQQESFYLSLRPNIFFSLHPDVEAKLTDRVKKWSAWKDSAALPNGVGHNMVVKRQEDPIGRLGGKN